MLRRRPDLSWPLLVLLLALFLLSVQAPRRWESVARHEPFTVPKEAAKPVALAQAHAPLPTAEIVRQTSAVSEEYHSAETTGPVASRMVVPSESELAPVTEVAAIVPLAPQAADGPILTPSVVTVNADDGAQPTAEHVDADMAGKHGSPVQDLARVALDLPGDNDPPTGNLYRSPSLEVAMVAAKDVPANPTPAEANASAEQTGPTAEVHVLRDSDAADVASTDSVKPEADAKPQAEVAVEKPVAAAESNSATAVPEPQPHPVISEPIATQPPAPVHIEPSALPAATTGDPHVLARNWEEPTYLLARIDELSKYPAVQPWGVEAADLVRKLGPALAEGSPKSLEIIDRLDRMTSEAAHEIPTIHDYAAAQDLCRVGHAIDRHIVIWRQIAQMGGLEAANAPAPEIDPQAMSTALAQIDALTKDSPEGAAWRNYLMTDSLRDWLNRRKSAHERLPREIGQQILKRLNQVALPAHQRQFMDSGPMASLHQEIVRHAAEPVEARRLLHDLEVYEQSGLPSDARRLAHDCQNLSVSAGTAQQQLGKSFETFYRNANMRLAISADLLNRMAPKRNAEYAPVSDNILGVPVRGQSLTASDISIKTIPDPHRALLALEVNGEIASLTQSTAGPATFTNDGEATYSARKPMEVTLRGIRVWPTEVGVDNSTKLRQVRTDYDHFPIVGGIARNVAISQLEAQKPAADAEVRQKIAAKASQRVDAETSEQINKAAQQLRDNLLSPMESLLLDPTMIAAETNEQRFNMRIRLAGSDQLGGHTPRPQAPADSLASVQIHESMLNNVLQRLELEGNTFSLNELGARIAQRLHRPAPKPADEDQEDVRISFAAQNALHVRCAGGRLEMTLAIAKLAKGSRKWKDFEVRAYYRPVVQGRNVELARDGVVQLPTPRLSTSSQIVLRGVFSKVFSQKENVKVTPPGFVNHPKLDGLGITQFVIDDGWIGVAIGPQRVAQVTPVSVRR